MIFHSHRPSQEDLKSKFRSNFKSKIITNAEQVLPFQKIIGRLLLETKRGVKHKGIYIQLEALCFLRYSTKIDGRSTLHQTRACVLPNNEKNRVVISPELFLPSDFTPISDGTQTFPFSLEIPGDITLPSSFRNRFGSLSYRLGVYIKCPDVGYYVDVGERQLRCDGYSNLLNSPTSLEPIRVEQSIKKSLLSKDKLVELELLLESSGYVIGENIRFSLAVKNPQCIPLQMGVQLVKAVRYDAAGKSEGVERTCLIVSKKEKDCLEPEAELTWMDCLPLGDSLKPSFSSAIFSISYSLQVQIVLDFLDAFKNANYGYQGVIKGDTPITIATTKDPFEILRERGHANQGDFSGSRGRSVSMSSLGSIITMPPAYSQLSSRRSSYETLPPNYEDLEMTEDI